jgi:2-hydroxychromene-2-carboxylate isomerase
MTALSQTHPSHVPAAGLALHTAHWAEHKRIAEPAVIEEVLAPIVGADVVRECLRRAGEKEVKDLLAQRTQAAFDCGAFCLPWFQGKPFGSL